MKLTLETDDWDTICLLVQFLSDNGFKVKSKDDPTLVKPRAAPAASKPEAAAKKEP